MNILKINKMINLILVITIIYAIFTFAKQQAKLNSYHKDITYYTSQKESLEKKHEELLATQENVNSPEYIEKMARDELDMYLPNETVYVDVNK